MPQPNFSQGCERKKVFAITTPSRLNVMSHVTSYFDEVSFARGYYMVLQYNTTVGLFQLKTSKSSNPWPPPSSLLAKALKEKSEPRSRGLAKFWESGMTQNELLHPLALPHGSNVPQYMVCVIKKLSTAMLKDQIYFWGSRKITNWK